MTSRTARLVAAAAVLVVPGLARASGFLLYEQSASALGKGSAVVASIRDPSAAWFNPAATAFLPGVGVSLSGALVFPRTSWTPAGGGDEVRSRTSPTPVPSLFWQVAIAERVRATLAVLVPFGLVVRWPDGWPGAQQSLITDLVVSAVNPSMAVRLHDRLAVAAGGSLLRGKVTLAQGLPPVPGGRADMEGDALGWAANVALLYRALPERLHLGAAYRSRTHLPFEGKVDFQTNSPGLNQIFSDQGASADITLPDLVALGAMWRPHPRLELSAELDLVFWSTFKELTIDFENPVTPDRRIERGSVNPLTGRLGLEWTWPDLGLAGRAGASFDQSASRKETLAPSAPDAHRLSLGAGLGYRRGRLFVDLAYLYAHLFPAESTAMPPGTYRSRAHVIALGLGVRLDAGP
jgi:long-chain fatty acid transport protein